MIAMTWRYYRRGPDAYGDEPRHRFARVHLTDDREPGPGSYLMCGRLAPDARDVDEFIIGDDAYGYAEPCASCQRHRTHGAPNSY